MKYISLLLYLFLGLCRCSAAAQNSLENNGLQILRSAKDDKNEEEASKALATVFDLPFTASAFDATDHQESRSNDVLGNCDRDGFDAQRTYDQTCQRVDLCHLGWTEPDEYLMYEFATDKNDFSWDPYEWDEKLLVTVIVRVASYNANRMVQLQIGNDMDAKEDWPTQIFTTPGRGYQAFQDVTWYNVRLNKDANRHQLFVKFLDGNVNLCSVTVKIPRIAPFRSPALDFDYYLDRDHVRFYNSEVCGVEREGLVDAQPTQDIICQKRDNSKCNIGWTFAGEYAYYDFEVLDSEDYRVWARIASERTDKTVRVELQVKENPRFDPLTYEPSSYEFAAPGLGWQEFVDVGFNIYLESGFHYRLRVAFDDGAVNLCSAGVDFMVHWGVGEYEIPITFNALNYDWALDSNPNEHRGNCPAEHQVANVDSKAAQDGTCLQSGPCYVAFTLPGEILRYDFSTAVNFSEPRQGPTGPMVDVILRIASFGANKHILVEVDGNRHVLEAPGKGWDEFEDVVWKNVQLRNTFYHQLYITMTTGYVNLCAITIQ